MWMGRQDHVFRIPSPAPLREGRGECVLQPHSQGSQSSSLVHHRCQHSCSAGLTACAGSFFSDILKDDTWCLLPGISGPLNSRTVLGHDLLAFTDGQSVFTHCPARPSFCLYSPLELIVIPSYWLSAMEETKKAH